MRTIVVLGAVAALAACNSSNDDFVGPVEVVPITPPPEVGQFGIVVGEPVATISATRGDGARH